MTINAISSHIPSLAVAAVSSDTPAKPTLSKQAAPNHPKGDTVKLSLEAQAKSLSLTGLDAKQIAEIIGTDVKTVDFYLGITASGASSVKQPSSFSRTA